jgi:hypothetical protein
MVGMVDSFIPSFEIPFNILNWKCLLIADCGAGERLSFEE